MQHISTVTVPSGGSSSINFMAVGDIPADYTDLLVVLSARAVSGAAVAMFISFNGSTANFSSRFLYGNGTAPESGSLARYIGSISGNYTANTFNSTSIYIPNYRASFAKSYSVDNAMENNATRNDMNIIAGLWSVTDAITSISMTTTNNFAEFSSASLYGVLAGSDGIVTVS